MKNQKIHDRAVELLNSGLLPADLTNIYILIKIVSFVFLIAVFSGVIGFILGRFYF